LLTGRQVFQGESTAEILAAVLKEEPDWKILPVSTPTKIRDLLRRCLQKDLRRRLHDAADARIEIEEALAAPAMAEATAAVKGIPVLGRQGVILSIGALLLVAVVTGLAVWNLKLFPAPPSQAVTRTAINLPPSQQLAGLDIGSAVALSRDGRWLAYVSDESGRFEIYVQPYSGPGGKWQISTEGGMVPVWNPNGRELFYRSGDRMMAVEIAMQSGFSAGKPKVLFEGQYEPTLFTNPNYDVSPDGKRFLMLKPSESAEAATQINVVLNWFEELKRRVPAGAK
jgi:WD40-like Beta Propeller Repeat